MEHVTFNPIGYIRSCFPEKFGIPRQPGLVSEATAILEIAPFFRRFEAFRRLETFSHLWIIFIFHECMREDWKPTVRPPRLGGNQRVGVFASRSGFRPNPIGQSVVELISIEKQKNILKLHLQGIDMMDNTPVLDIKPYLPYADQVPHARPGYAGTPPERVLKVTFSDTASKTCSDIEQHLYPNFKRTVEKLLSLDPRPGYQTSKGRRSYGMRLFNTNIRFTAIDDTVIVDAIETDKNKV
ncbi:MAG: tRNA (N6-threonylcarbamoyladenosine(37)-N6)-methyltransferase TrmO [Desulfobacteraceae bacterium]|nr:tRNA (N6-threonylcarbamoyladenosine(37)-N6)-methyltransferase TrmO [Desulfobacteraceae bacterium]